MPRKEPVPARYTPPPSERESTTFPPTAFTASETTAGLTGLPISLASRTSHSEAPFSASLSATRCRRDWTECLDCDMARIRVKAQLPSLHSGSMTSSSRTLRRLHADVHAAVAVVWPANGFAKMLHSRRGLQVVAYGGLWWQVAGGGRWWQVAAAGGRWWQVAAGEGRWWQVAVAGSCWQVAAAGGRWWQVAGSGRWWQVVAGGGRWQVVCGGRWW